MIVASTPALWVDTAWAQDTARPACQGPAGLASAWCLRPDSEQRWLGFAKWRSAGLHRCCLWLAAVPGRRNSAAEAASPPSFCRPPCLATHLPTSVDLHQQPLLHATDVTFPLVLPHCTHQPANIGEPALTSHQKHDRTFAHIFAWCRSPAYSVFCAVLAILSSFNTFQHTSGL